MTFFFELFDTITGSFSTALINKETTTLTQLLEAGELCFLISVQISHFQPHHIHVQFVYRVVGFFTWIVTPDFSALKLRSYRNAGFLIHVFHII